jgi:hydroxyethylthiazole kinase
MTLSTPTFEAGLAAEDLLAIRRMRPLVHCITNLVSMNLVANAVLAVGASPIMASAVEEVEEITAGAGALLLNTGTITPSAVEAMRRASTISANTGIPIVIDPVGAGASAYRRRVVQELMDLAAPAVIRANPSEIMALAGTRTSHGVDSIHPPDQALETAHGLVRRWKCPVVVSGPVDYVVSEHRTVSISNGAHLMGRVTGMGCAAGALIAAFAAVGPDGGRAATCATIAGGVAGELAAVKAHGPGSFQAFFLDALFNLNATRLRETIRMQIISRR